MLTISNFGPPPARASRGRARAAEESPPLVRGVVALVHIGQLALAAPRVALTGRYRGARVHPLAYVAALLAVAALVATLWGGVSETLLTTCDTSLPRPLAALACGASRVLTHDAREGLLVVDTGGVRCAKRAPTCPRTETPFLRACRAWRAPCVRAATPQ
jgi:hypothetical protein